MSNSIQGSTLGRLRTIVVKTEIRCNPQIQGMHVMKIFLVATIRKVKPGTLFLYRCVCVLFEMVLYSLGRPGTHQLRMTFNPTTQQAEGGRPLSSRTVPGQLGIHREKPYL